MQPPATNNPGMRELQLALNKLQSPSPPAPAHCPPWVDESALLPPEPVKLRWLRAMNRRFLVSPKTPSAHKNGAEPKKKQTCFDIPATENSNGQREMVRPTMPDVHAWFMRTEWTTTSQERQTSAKILVSWQEGNRKSAVSCGLFRR